MTDSSTPVPSDEAIDAAHADLMRPRCRTVIVDRRNVPSALAAAYAIDAPRLRAEAAAEARAATLREVEHLREAITRVGTRCRVNHADFGKGGATCREIRDSAVRALATGEQPVRGSRWGVDPGTDPLAPGRSAWRAASACAGAACWQMPSPPTSTRRPTNERHARPVV